MEKEKILFFFFPFFFFFNPQRTRTGAFLCISSRVKFLFCLIWLVNFWINSGRLSWCLSPLNFTQLNSIFFTWFWITIRKCWRQPRRYKLPPLLLKDSFSDMIDMYSKRFLNHCSREVDNFSRFLLAFKENHSTRVFHILQYRTMTAISNKRNIESSYQYVLYLTKKNSDLLIRAFFFCTKTTFSLLIIRCQI